MRQPISIRPAVAADAAAVAEIFNQGVADRVATFETREYSPEDAARMIAATHLMLVAECDGSVVGWAKAGPYSDDHDYYAGVGEATLYVERAQRRSGIGSALLEAVAAAGPDVGLHKLVGKVFTSNAASIAMLRKCGWLEVGTHRRHGRLDGEWKDVLVVERLLS